ncbi:MAG TPA: 23S rRNA (uracil(1939)-C(5))-methyltransferase RlmD, partial [Caldimonas sp.]|nr:23S rRNA (uracil(1939)-C(5))-methyltransferase RlmD [Caldimonas sp.]
DPLLRPVLEAVRREVEALEIPVHDERIGEGVLRYALARASRLTSEVHLTLVATTEGVPRLRQLLARMRRAHASLRAVFLCVNRTPGNRLLSHDIRRLFGPMALRERFGQLQLESRPDAFVQANVAVASRLYETARRWLAPRPSDVVVDLYSGVGAIAITLADSVARVLGVERSVSAVDCARANARRAGRANVEIVAAGAEHAVSITRQRQLRRVDAVIVNPPRAGLTLEAREAVVALAARHVLYVSCDPATLARDLGWLAGRGYALRRVRGFDMMPQTPHIETLALVVRR